MNTWDIHALTRQIQDATRSMEIASAHIFEQTARINVLEEENTRLRLRLARAMETIRRMEAGEL